MKSTKVEKIIEHQLCWTVSSAKLLKATPYVNCIYWVVVLEETVLSKSLLTGYLIDYGNELVIPSTELRPPLRKLVENDQPPVTPFLLDMQHWRT
ncbi:hypothetical protein quinque_015565 [Culex quinquefasciatus]